ncbi:MAG: PKD domain-containing protein [Novosphingobium sp.]
MSLVLAASSAQAASCPSVGEPKFGAEAPMVIDAECVDPDYNDKTFVLDSTKPLSLTLPDGSAIPYTEVKGHFPATRTQAQLPAGVTGSPTTTSHAVTWLFPDRTRWHNRFFQQSYPLPLAFLNTVDSRFAFTNGAYTVSVMPGNSVVGYRVNAAAAKLAKTFANKLYGNSARIYGYIYGQSGGSVQMMGANEGTTGVWDGIVPVVIAVDGLNTHSFQWNALYALAVPQTKRQAVADAVAPGSGLDPYAGFTSGERAILDELLNAGFARKALEGWEFSVGSALPLSGALATFDPVYEEDFWSKPGYEGVNPPAYLAAAKVDGFATIVGMKRNDKDVITAITFDPATVPPLGSIGAEGLQFYVYAADGVSRIVNGQARRLSGKLAGNILTLDAANDPVLLGALTSGAKIRINNRFLLAACFYPRHSILDNGSPAYDQYKNADGTPKYVQRPLQTAYIANLGAAGGRLETGHLKVKTIVLENLFDPASYPYVGGFYAQQVQRAMGPREAQDIFRIYYQENAPHGAFPDPVQGTAEAALSTKIASVGGILNQTLLDLAAWAERGITPLPSSRYRRDAMNQVVLPKSAAERQGLQPVVELTANGSIRAEVSVNQPVTLAAKIDMPRGAGKIVHYAWYLGTADTRFEPATELRKPSTHVDLKRTVSFAAPGEYSITLRVNGQRSGLTDVNGTTLLQNIGRVRVVVH